MAKKSAKSTSRRKPAKRTTKRTPARRVRAASAVELESVAVDASVAETMAGVSARVTNCNVSLPKVGELSMDAAFATPLAGEVPNSDRRGEFTWPIGDQVHNGACVGWAVGDGLLRWHLVHQRGLSATEPLSVRYFWMAAKEMDEYIGLPTTFLELEGTSIWAALKMAIEFGCLKASVLPQEGSLYRASKEQFLAEAAQLKIGQVQKLEPDLDEWARWLAEKGPLAVRLTVDAVFELAAPGREFLSVYTSYPDPWNHGHAAVLVGYVREQDKNWFIVRNSWGQTWGRDGHAFVSREYVKASFTEAWGVRR